MVRRATLVLWCACFVVSVLGLVGCKNVCDKALDKAESCMRDFCAAEENADSPRCEGLDDRIAEMRSNAAEEECTSEDADRVEPLLELECDDFMTGLAAAIMAREAPEEGSESE